MNLSYLPQPEMFTVLMEVVPFKCSLCNL